MLPLNSIDMMMIDILLFEQTIKEKISKIKEMDVAKINHLQDTANILAYTLHVDQIMFAKAYTLTPGKEDTLSAFLFIQALTSRASS